MSLKRKITGIITSSWLLHLLFWALSFYVLLRLFRLSSETHPIDYLYTGLFHLSLVLSVYINLLWLIPAFLRNRKYVLYGLLASSLIVFSSLFNQYLFNTLIDHILPGFYFISYYDYIDILKFHAVYLVLTSLLKLSKEWFELMETKIKLAELDEEKTRSELIAMKAQVNPHFLLNSLNNIYAMALDKDTETPGTILKLSDIFRYMLYEADEDMVTLVKEIDILQKYIGLQKIRSSDRAKISFDIQGSPGNHRIAPLLLLPLVENSFKHGVKGETGDSWVKMNLTLEDSLIRFTISNNKGKTDDIEGMREGGIGLENLKRRLELQYPGKHLLMVENGREEFTVFLELNDA